MKHLYLLSIGLLSVAAGTPAEGKVAGVSVPGPYPHTPSQSSAATAAVNTRVIAKSYYIYKNGQFTPVDSSDYQYSGGRGGSPEELDQSDDAIYFDVSHRYVYNAGVWGNNLKRTQTFGINNRIEMLYYQPWDSSKNNWENSYRYAYLYDGSGRISQARKDIWDGYSWPTGNNYPYSNSYNSNNGLLQEIIAYQQDYQFYYDNNNNLNCRIVLERALGVPWTYTIRDSFCYDALGRVSYILHQVYNLVSQSWVNDTRTTYTYTNTSEDIDHSIVEAWSTTTGSWQKKEQHLFTYDVAHNKLSDVAQLWNGQSYASASRIAWTYNMNSQVTSIITATWNNTAGNWIYTTDNYQRFFYYETYFPTSVKNLDDVVVNMDLFPSPAQDAVHFRIDWRTPQAFSMNVTDMQGRVLQQWDEQGTKNYERTLDVSQWSSGNYLLTVSGTNGHATRRFVVAK